MLIFSIIALIMSNALNNRRDFAILYNRISILILIYSFIVIYNSFFNSYIYKGIIILNGLFCVENYSIFFSLFILLLSILIIELCAVYFYNDLHLKVNLLLYYKNFFNILKHINWKDKISVNIMNEYYRVIEYPLIILFCIIGTIFLVFSFDIVSVFLSIELQSYALYLICSIYRNSESSTNAGLTYFLLGSLSSCIILLGLSFLYINSGSTNIENIFIINNISDIYTYNMVYNSTNNIDNINLYFIDIFLLINTQYIYLQISLLLMSVGFLFKIASAPFHFWSPDVYDAVPTITTTFISIIPKISILMFLYKIIYFTSSDIIVFSWVNNIILSSIMSLIIGSVLGLIQFRIKRLYAYSTISHIGFLLIGLSINNIESTKAFFFYLVQYSMSNLNAFLILIVIGYTLRGYIFSRKNTVNLKIKDINYSPIQLVSQLRGYYNINPLLSISLSLTLFSFVGVPPLIGFFGKQMILASALNSGLFFIVLVAIITSVISAVYYLVIVKEIFFEKEYIKKIINRNVYSKYNLISPFYSLNIAIISLIQILFIFFDQIIYKIFNILLIS